MPALTLKYFAYRLRDRRLTEPLRRFAAAWMRPEESSGEGPGERLRVVLSGEVYMRVSQADAVFRGLLTELGFRRFRLEHGPLWSYLEYLLAAAEQDRGGARRRQARLLRLALRRLLAAPLYRAARLPMPPAVHRLLAEARELLPTLRPEGELPIYTGEALEALRGGADLFLNVAPNGCMVASMGEALGPALARAAGGGRIQPLFSADGEVNEELLGLAVLKVLGPEGYYRSATGARASIE